MDREGPLDRLVGQVLASRYRIGDRLGAGAMGTVFRAEHVKVGRKLAVKVLHPRMLEHEKFRRRFEREAELAGQMRHPNVAGVIDVGITPEGLRYLVMEYAEGPTLTELLRGSAPFEGPRAARIARQLCEGLHHAHEHGLIHRDFKPDNVIIERGADGDETARILDFGIAIEMADLTEGERRRLTTEGMVLGTPHYMAPEHAAGQPIDHRIDLFALGVICFEMLTGAMPFVGSGVDVARAYLSKPIPAMNQRAPQVEVDPLLEAFTRALLERQREARLPSAKIARDLLDLIEEDRAAAARQLGMRLHAPRRTLPVSAAPPPRAGSGTRQPLPTAWTNLPTEKMAAAAKAAAAEASARLRDDGDEPTVVTDPPRSAAPAPRAAVQGTAQGFAAVPRGAAPGAAQAVESAPEPAARLPIAVAAPLAPRSVERRPIAVPAGTTPLPLISVPVGSSPLPTLTGVAPLVSPEADTGVSLEQEIERSFERSTDHLTDPASAIVTELPAGSAAPGMSMYVPGRAPPVAERPARRDTDEAEPAPRRRRTAWIAAALAALIPCTVGVVALRRDDATQPGAPPTGDTTPPPSVAPQSTAPAPAPPPAAAPPVADPAATAAAPPVADPAATAAAPPPPLAPAPPAAPIPTVDPPPAPAAPDPATVARPPAPTPPPAPAITARPAPRPTPPAPAPPPSEAPAVDPQTAVVAELYGTIGRALKQLDTAHGQQATYDLWPRFRRIRIFDALRSREGRIGAHNELLFLEAEIAQRSK